MLRHGLGNGLRGRGLVRLVLRRRVAKVNRWLEARGWELRASTSYWCDLDERAVYYRDGEHCIEQGLAHECGHVLIASQRGRRFKYGYKAGYPPTKLAYADVLDEECSAWYRGLALMRRLGIRVDERRFWRAYADGVVSYARSG